MVKAINLRAEQGAVTRFLKAHEALAAVQGDPILNMIEAATAISTVNAIISDARRQGAHPRLRLIDAFKKTYEIPITKETRVGPTGNFVSSIHEDLPSQAEWKGPIDIRNLLAVVTDEALAFAH